MNQITTNKLTMLLVISLLLVFTEVTFFGNGSIIFALLGIVMIYMSISKRRKWLFWMGATISIISLFSMWSLRILVVATLLYILWQLKKGAPVSISLTEQFNQNQIGAQSIIQNKAFSFQRTPTNAYEWQDIHVQGIVGDLTIDTTQTLLPKGTSLISVRQGFGKVRIAVPYEVPVRIHFNTLVGDVQLFGNKMPRLWNKTISMKDGYNPEIEHTVELIITVSTLLGDVEVIRK
ncbi:cell wall-active antibiotics response protein LiaF [Viridibacillus arvi]|uniref:cell wall-active antibiotics response protein LiaF n=1 Tax=Viridibacillus arvi TaxID=263475 RepID=UPI00187B463D|nr:cell wall-active antibiotics response protein LiaF [Viridibacillus sp. JNUCC-6]QOV10232.1 cell wall-active antibiotics response protein [Viridibacillus sp. JNUCC-6]